MKAKGDASKCPICKPINDRFLAKLGGKSLDQETKEAADYICLLVTRERNNGRKFPLKEIAEVIQSNISKALIDAEQEKEVAQYPIPTSKP